MNSKVITLHQGVPEEYGPAPPGFRATESRLTAANLSREQWDLMVAANRVPKKLVEFMRSVTPPSVLAQRNNASGAIYRGPIDMPEIPTLSAAQLAAASYAPLEIEQTETDEEIGERLIQRFNVLDILVQGAIGGKIRAATISGPPGVGKSFSVHRALRQWDSDREHHVICSGYYRPPELYRIMHKYQLSGKVVVFDDADSIFRNENSLNLLKKACDTLDERHISWGSDYDLGNDENGDPIPHSFDFDGSILFITNLDFEREISARSGLAEHMEALMSRSHYMNMGMRTKRDYIVRIRQVMLTPESNMLDFISEKQRKLVMEFIETNVDRLRELSLRTAIKVGQAINLDSKNWRILAEATTCR